MNRARKRTSKIKSLTLTTKKSGVNLMPFIHISDASFKTCPPTSSCEQPRWGSGGTSTITRWIRTKSRRRRWSRRTLSLPSSCSRAGMTMARERWRKKSYWGRLCSSGWHLITNLRGKSSTRSTGAATRRRKLLAYRSIAKTSCRFSRHRILVTSCRTFCTKSCALYIKSRLNLSLTLIGRQPATTSGPQPPRSNANLTSAISH